MLSSHPIPFSQLEAKNSIQNSTLFIALLRRDMPGTRGGCHGESHKHQAARALVELSEMTFVDLFSHNISLR